MDKYIATTTSTPSNVYHGASDVEPLDAYNIYAYRELDLSSSSSAERAFQAQLLGNASGSEEEDHESEEERPSSSSAADSRTIDWNARFQSILDLPENDDKQTLAKYRELSSLAVDFITVCQTYGKLIIAEFFLAPSEKTIRTADLGGLAGGSKFVVHNILFKLTEDAELGEGRWLYGGRVQNDELAAKAAGADLKGAIALSRAHDLVQLSIPLQAIIDYRGFRMVAMPVLPLAGAPAYGSGNKGKTVAADPVFHDKIGQLARAFHLASHQVGDVELWTAGDVEGHIGTDGRSYLLDLARCFPPEAPIECPHLSPLPQAVFSRYMRPEYLQIRREQGAPPLSSDAFTGWGGTSEAAVRHNENAREATRHLVTEVIPGFARSLLAMDAARLAEVARELPRTLHSAGINVRHMGLVRAHLLVELASARQAIKDKLAESEAEARASADRAEAPARRSKVARRVHRAAKPRTKPKKSRPKTAVSKALQAEAAKLDQVAAVARALLTQMVGRTVKNMLRHLLRREMRAQNHRVSESHFRQRVAWFLNLVTGACGQSQLRRFWQTRVLTGVQLRFGPGALTADPSFHTRPQSERALLQERDLFELLTGIATCPASDDEPTASRTADTSTSIAQGIENMRTVVLYVLDTTGQRLTERSRAEFIANPIGFQFLQPDLLDMEARIKHMSLIDVAQAKVLTVDPEVLALRREQLAATTSTAALSEAEDAAAAGQQSVLHADSRRRLQLIGLARRMSLSLSRFRAAVGSNPLDQRIVREVQLAEVREKIHSHEVRGELTEADQVLTTALAQYVAAFEACAHEVGDAADESPVDSDAVDDATFASTAAITLFEDILILWRLRLVLYPDRPVLHKLCGASSFSVLRQLLGHTKGKLDFGPQLAVLQQAVQQQDEVFSSITIVRPLEGSEIDLLNAGKTMEATSSNGTRFTLEGVDFEFDGNYAGETASNARVFADFCAPQLDNFFAGNNVALFFFGDMDDDLAMAGVSKASKMPTLYSPSYKTVYGLPKNRGMLQRCLADILTRLPELEATLTRAHGTKVTASVQVAALEVSPEFRSKAWDLLGAEFFSKGNVKPMNRMRDVCTWMQVDSSRGSLAKLMKTVHGNTKVRHKINSTVHRLYHIEVVFAKPDDSAPMPGAGSDDDAHRPTNPMSSATDGANSLRTRTFQIIDSTFFAAAKAMHNKPNEILVSCLHVAARTVYKTNRSRRGTSASSEDLPSTGTALSHQASSSLYTDGVGYAVNYSTWRQSRFSTLLRDTLLLAGLYKIGIACCVAPTTLNSPGNGYLVRRVGFAAFEGPSKEWKYKTVF